MTGLRRRRRDERGAVGGLEALLLGLLVVLGGVGLMVNTWTVIETRAALDAAAREYLRSYGEQSDAISAERAGSDAAHAVLRERGTPLDGVRVSTPDAGRFGPCQRVEITLSVEVDRMRVPFIDAIGSTTVSVTASELIDAHREVLVGDRYDLADTACGG